jgi:long-chain fatty acid transport protein
MRRLLLVLALCSFAALPLFAQNTDIESLSGLQFNFGNPGARSLGMGGAFIGLADDASAAEANPAGLTILRKREISLETRNYLEQQTLTTTGTYPDVTRGDFSHYSNRAEISFGSFVYPLKNFTFGVYYHEPLKNAGTGQVVPQRNERTGKIDDVPNFYLPNGGGNGPVSQTECQAIRQKANDPFACLEYTINPFLTKLEVQEKTWGIAAAYKVGKFSFGATGRMQLFREESYTYRVTPTGDFLSISVQATAKSGGTVFPVFPPIETKKDVTFAAGVKWGEPSDPINIGAVYKKGAKFVTPTFIFNANTNFAYVKLADTTFHIPDMYGIGISSHPLPSRWSIAPYFLVNFDAVRVKYSNLVDDFVSTITDVQGLKNPYKANDVTELHIGGEYFFPTKVPVAIRAGFWRDPAHSMQWNGPLTTPDAVGAAILYPKGKAQNHKSIGGGIALPRFQIDLGYDTSEHYKVGSVSAVVRF